MSQFITNMLGAAAHTVQANIINIDPLPDTPADGSTLRILLDILFLTMGAVAVLIITYSGFVYVISHGDPRMIEQAKNSIFYAVIGLIVLASAFALVNVFLGGL